MIFDIDNLSEQTVDRLWDTATERGVPLVYVLDDGVTVSVGWDCSTLPAEGRMRCRYAYQTIEDGFLRIVHSLEQDRDRLAVIGLSGKIGDLDHDEAETVAQMVDELLEQASDMGWDRLPVDIQDDRLDPVEGDEEWWVEPGAFADCVGQSSGGGKSTQGKRYEL